jgi:hypothetical protein
MKLTLAMLSALLLVTPGFAGEATPTSQPSMSGQARGGGLRASGSYAPTAPAEVLIKQFELVVPASVHVTLTTAAVPTPPGRPAAQAVMITADTQEQVQEAHQLLKELDNLAAKATQQTRAFVLKNARAKDAAESLQRLLNSRDVILTIDERTNRLLIVAAEAQLKRAEELVQMLDVPVAETETPPVRVFPVRHAKLETLKDPLRLLMPGMAVMPGGGQSPSAWGAFAIDPASQQVIVKGTPEMLKQVEDLLNKLDVPPSDTQSVISDQAVQVRLIWLTTLDSASQVAPPRDLNDVLGELEAIGVKNLKLVTQTMVPSVVGEEFNITGTAKLDRPLDLAVTGQLSSIDRLSVRLAVRGEAEPLTPGQPKTISDLVNIKTTVVSPPGQSVVLGVSSQSDHQDVFILQVREVGR